MLQLNHLSLSLSRSGRVLLKDLSFHLSAGEKAVLIGEEGNGKSTLLRLIYDPKTTGAYAEYDGEIIKRGRFAYLPQELDEGAKRLSVCDFVALCAASQGELISAAVETGLPPELISRQRPLATLSGGERVKLQLTALLAQRPDVLLLDEPSNDLDLSAIEWLEDFISSTPLAVLFISHDETLISNTADTVIHIEQLVNKSVPRCTVAHVPYEKYVSARQRGIVSQTRIANKQREEFEKQQARFQRIYERVHFEQNKVSRGDPHSGRLMKKKMKTVIAQQRRFQKQEEGLLKLPQPELPVMPRWLPDIPLLPRGKAAIELSLLGLEAGGRKLCGPLSLYVAGGEKVCIIGANGCGKTTLMRELANSVSDRRDLRAMYFPQDYSEAIPPQLTPVQFLCTRGDAADVARVRTALGSMRYTSEEMLRPCGQLSGGQRAKLLFLSAVLRRCNLLLLDEPTRNFSPLSAGVIRKMLCEFPGTIVAVSHDRAFISELPDRVLMLDSGGLTSC